MAEGINLRKVGDDRIGISLDERTRREHTQAVWRAFGGDMLDRALDHEYRLPEGLVRTSAVPDASDLPHEPGRGGDDPLHAPAGRPGSGARPGDDPARLVHDEAERHRGDDGAELAGVRRHPSVRAVGPDRGLCGGDRRPLRQALRDHRLRRVLDAAELRRAGRVCRAADDPGVSREPRRGAPRRLPDPDLGARHQPGERADGGDEGRAGAGGGERRRRPRRLPRQGGGGGRPARGLHDHLSVDARGVRGDGARGLRDHPCRTAGRSISTART